MDSLPTLLPVNKPRSLKDIAYARIKEAIVSLRLRPGQALSQSDLARQLQISETPIRDALQELEREGFVVRIPHKGTFVTPIAREDLEEIVQIISVLEGLAARLATPRLTPEDIQEADRLLTQAAAALARGDRETCSTLGRQFHQLLIQKAGNQRLVSMLGTLDDHLKRFRRISDQIGGRLEKSQEQHRRVLEAVKLGDAIAAEEAMLAHWQSVFEDLMKGGMNWAQEEGQ